MIFTKKTHAEKRAAMRMIGRFFARVRLDGFVLV